MVGRTRQRLVKHSIVAEIWAPEPAARRGVSCPLWEAKYRMGTRAKMHCDGPGIVVLSAWESHWFPPAPAAEEPPVAGAAPAAIKPHRCAIRGQADMAASSKER